MRAVFTLPVIAILCFLLVIPVSAANEDDTVSALLEAGGAGELTEALPDTTRDALEEADLSADPYSLLSFSFSDLLSTLLSFLKEYVTAPLKLFATLCGVLLLSSLLSSLGEEGSYQKAFSFVAVLTCCGVLVEPLLNLIENTVETITNSSYFLTAFVPVFSSALTASGKPLSAFTYHAVLFSAVQMLSQVAVQVLLPLLQIYLALCIVSGIEPMLKLGGVAESVKKAVTWTIGIGLTLFVGLLSLQGMVANASDTLTTRTARYVVSSAIPVVGGAVSEVLTSIQSCLGVMRTVLGSFGVLACLFLFLPSVVSLLLYLCALQGAALVGDFLNAPQMVSLCKSGVTVLSMLLGILICFALFVIVTTTMMILLVGG